MSEDIIEIADVRETPKIKCKEIEGSYYTIKPHTCGTCGLKRICCVIEAQDYKDIDTFHCFDCYTGELGMDEWKGKIIEFDDDGNIIGRRKDD